MELIKFSCYLNCFYLYNIANSSLHKIRTIESIEYMLISLFLLQMAKHYFSSLINLYLQEIEALKQIKICINKNIYFVYS